MQERHFEAEPKLKWEPAHVEGDIFVTLQDFKLYVHKHDESHFRFSVQRNHTLMGMGTKANQQEAQVAAEELLKSLRLDQIRSDRFVSG